MESDEKYIEARLGRKSPFVVPEGYFDNLAQSIVDNVASANIADKKNDADVDPVADICPVADVYDDGQAKVVKLDWWHRYRVRIAAAACIAFAVAGLSSYFALSSADSNGGMHVAIHGEHAVESQTSSNMSDIEIDYTMLDNDDIYVLVSEIQ